jgi:hypothetical protein
MKKQSNIKSFTKMNSEELLRKVSKGNLSKQNAQIAADILERRFPTPKR